HNPATVTPERTQLRATGRVPEANRSAGAGRGDAPAIRAVSDAVDLVGVPLQCPPVGVAEVVPVMPLEAAEIVVAAAPGEVGVEEFLEPIDLGGLPADRRQAHIGKVGAIVGFSSLLSGLLRFPRRMQ